MREFFRRFGHDDARIIREYAAAERRGDVQRTSNDYGLLPEDYARRLLADARKKVGFVASAERPLHTLKRGRTDKQRL